MTVTIRSLVLLSACILAAGCSEPETETSKAKLVPKAPSTAPTAPPLPHMAAEPALTSAAPLTPRSVLDAKGARDAEGIPGEKTVSEPPKPSTSSGLEASPQPIPIDFDRPLSPEEVKIDRFVLATGVADREPLGESTVFGPDIKIFAFVQVANEGAPYAFRVHWEPVDGPSSPYGVKLNVKTAKRFRTWSWTAIVREPGRYKAVLRTLDGRDIASREFQIAASDDAAPTL